MAVCTAGSEPQPAAPTYFTIDDAYIALKFGSMAGWLTIWAMGLPATPQVTADFCAVDPPTEMPTAADWLKLSTPLIAFATGTYTRFANQIRADKWADLCQCKATTGSCTVGIVGTYPAASWTPDNAPATWLASLDPLTKRLTLDFTGVSNPSFPSAYYASLSVDNGSGGSFAQLPTWTFYPLTTTHFDSGVLSSGHPYRRGGFTLSAGAAGRTISITGATLRVTECYTTSGPPYTPPVLPPPPTGFPTPPPSPACANPSDICNFLNALATKLDWTRMEIQLLQRWGIPMAYRFGATHTGLSGTGSILITRLLGLQAVLTTVPPGVVVKPGGTAYLWDMGWMSIEGPEGMVLEKRITRQALEWIEPKFQLGTVFKYQLNPGVVMAVSELLPEA